MRADFRVIEMTIKAIFVGFGNVGRTLCKEIFRCGIDIEIRGAISSKGGVLIEEKDDLKALCELADRDLKLDRHPKFKEGFEVEGLVENVKPDLAYISLPPNYITGEPNKTIYRKLVDAGVNIIIADKTVLALEYRDFMDYASRRKVFVGYRATVAAGTPFTDVARGLRGREITRIKAMFNVTSNYILSLMEEGLSYEEAVKKTVEIKLAEPDPRMDTHGWDLAAKLAIITSILGENLGIHEIVREPLEKVSQSDVARARERGQRIMYLGEADLEKRSYYVGPREIPLSHPFASIRGMYSGLEAIIEGDRMTIIGPAGPIRRTALVMITDTLEFLEWHAMRS